MNIAIVGSRSFVDYAMLTSVMDEYRLRPEGIKTIISGGALGADKMAERYAKLHSIPVTIHLPEWNTYGKSAGAVRNQLIVNDSDMVVAFWDGQSKGTSITIEMAKRSRKQLRVV